MEVTKNGSVKKTIAKSKVEGSSSDDSDSESEDDEEPKNKAPLVALAAKKMDVSSDESNSEDSSDSDDDALKVKAPVKPIPIGAVSKKGTITIKKKDESSDDSDSNDSSSSDDDSPVPNATLSKKPSSTTASKKMQLNLTLKALIYNTTRAYYNCSLAYGECTFRTSFSVRNTVVLTTPGTKQGVYYDDWYVELSYGPRWITYTVGFGGMAVLIFLAFCFMNCCQHIDNRREAQYRGTGSQRAPPAFTKR